MGTIIAHGKSQWGRANKNIRTDAELEAEREAIAQQLPKSVGTSEADILKGISENIDAGTKVITKVFKDASEIKNTLRNNVSSIEVPNETRAPISLSHSNQIDKKYKNDDVVSKEAPINLINGVVTSPPVVEEVDVEVPVKRTRNSRKKPAEKETPIIEETSEVKITEPVVEEVVPVEEVIEIPKPKKKKTNKKKKVEISAPTDTTSFISDKAYTLAIEKDII